MEPGRERARHPCATEVDEESGAGGARLAERGRRSFGNFDGAVEEIFAGGKELESLAEVVRGVGVEAEVAVEKIGVGVVVKLVAAQTALQTKGPERRRDARRLSVARLRATSGNPIAEIPASGEAAGLSNW